MTARPRFDPDQRRALETAVLEGRNPDCPECRVSLDRREVPPRSDVAYVRDRVLLVCPSCRRSLSLDRRGR